MNKKIEDNRNTWNVVSKRFLNASHLPSWGPFSAGKDLDLVREIKNKTFLEIACGSGRSIKYLINNGAKKVYALDFSEKQIEEATSFNRAAIKQGKVEIFHQTMEEKLNIEPVDLIFSVYGFGWTQNAKKTLANIYSYLKPGGRFIWSWDHTFFTQVEYQDGKFVVTRPYHGEKPIPMKNWLGAGHTAYITYRKTSTWHRLLTDTGFTVAGYYEPEPVDLNWGHNEPEKYYSIQKAKLIPCSIIFECQKPSK